MSLNLSIVCHDRGLSQQGQSENAVRAIGEILPFILAKYGVDSSAAKQNRRLETNKDRLSPRFNDDVESWKF